VVRFAAMHKYIFDLLLAATCGYALWRGRKYERIIAFVFLAASIVSIFALSPRSVRYVGLETSDMVIDSFVLMAVVAVALISDRFWPLWIAGLQLVDSSSHLMKAIDMSLVPRAYAAAERFWSYPMLLILFLGAWRSHRREVRAAAALSLHGGGDGAHLQGQG